MKKISSRTSRSIQNRQSSQHKKTTKTKQNTQRKKVSPKDLLTKVVDALKPVDSECQPKIKVPDVPFAESTSPISTSTKFFYSNDEIINNFDDWHLYQTISQQFPGMLATETNDITKKNAMINMLNDHEFMNDILKQYNMTILDFFKFLFRLCPSMFKGTFIKKLQNVLKNKSYAKSLKFGNYSFLSKRRRSKRCSIF